MAIIIIRTIIIYLALLVTMRVLGKRQLGELELSEFVVAALIADLASHPLQDLGIPMINGLVPIFTLFCCEVLITGLSLKSIRLRGLLFGKPSFLIVRGKIDQAEMRKSRFTSEELMQKLHEYKLRRVRHTRNRRHTERHPLPCRAPRDSRAAWDKHVRRRLSEHRHKRRARDRHEPAKARP